MVQPNRPSPPSVRPGEDPRRGVHTLVLLLVLLLALFLGACTSQSEARKAQVKKGTYHYQLGANYFSERMIPQSLRELLLAVEADPENADAYHMLGFIYMGRRAYPQAIRYFKEATRLRPDFYICLNNLGTAYLAARRWDDAIALYEELVTRPMYNTPELAYNNLGWAYYNLQRDQQASEAFEMAVFLKPEMCLAHNNLGLVRLRDRNDLGARRSFEAAIKQCPTYAEPHFHLGQILRTRNDPNARFYYQRCFELAADSNLGDRCRSYLEVIH